MKKLEDGEQIITAYAQLAEGPGWENWPIWVLIRTRNGMIREECLQPEEQTAEMITLYGVAVAVHEAMIRAIRE